MSSNNMNHMRSAVAILLAMATSSCLLANCQFLPQSHLGRLVQSITSPLVISSQAGGYRSNDDSDSPGADGSGYYGPPGGAGSDPSDESSGAGRANQQQQQQQQQVSQLQQAPSQQRGVPTQQHYFNEDDQGGAPSNNKHTQDYQMGAYLGPSMDDKEINGAFNSNDERDDDDGPAGYDGPSSAPAMGRGRAAASNTYHNNNHHGGSGDGYGPSSYGRPAGAAQGGYGGNSAYDEDGADEDEPPAPRARHQQGRSSAGYGRSGLSQAASQYQQRGSSGDRQSLVAAANGYSPYPYGTGPIDLNGLMAGVSGDPSAGYQVYQGDGSYPGASYYQQQAQGGRQRPVGRSASNAAGQMNSYNNNNNNNNNNGYYDANSNANGFNQAAPLRARSNAAAEQANNYNDERDNDNDED